MLYIRAPRGMGQSHPVPWDGISERHPIAWDETFLKDIPFHRTKHFREVIHLMGQEIFENIPLHSMGRENFSEHPTGSHGTNIFCRNLFLLRTIWSFLLQMPLSLIWIVSVISQAFLFCNWSSILTIEMQYNKSIYKSTYEERTQFDLL
jgi:hypothetical protein